MKSIYQRFIDYYPFFVLGIASTFLMMIFYWLLFPYKTIEVIEPMPVITKEVRAGDVVQYITSYCKHTNAPSTISWQIRNSHALTIPGGESSAPLGCHEFISSSVSVPKFFTTGEYTVVFITNYKVNPIRTISHSFETEPFNVIE